MNKSENGLRESANKPCMKCLEMLQHDVAAFFLPHSQHKGSSGRKMKLVEIACLGKPEMTLQGELLFHLRTEGWNCVQEAGYSQEDKKRNLDLLVFSDSNMCGSDHGPKDVLCCIELKHFSANQGEPTTLYNGLGEDAKLPRPKVGERKAPVMLVGMFTTIEFEGQACERDGLYRFFRSLSQKKAKVRQFKKAFVDHQIGNPYFAPSIISRDDDSLVQKFRLLSTGEEVTGSVEAYVCTTRGVK